MRRVLPILLCLAPWLPAVSDERPDPGPRPSILVHCPRPSADQWGWWVDLRYLKELQARGFEVDYTDRHQDLTWDRARRYDVLVLFVVPLADSAYYNNTPARPPYRDEFVGIVERFLEAGGGVFLMAEAINADESFLPLIGRWGARIPYERIEESDPQNLAPLPRMRLEERLWFTDNVPASPVADGVEQVWLPLAPRYAAAETMPIRVDDDWTVVLRGSRTSRTVLIDSAKVPVRRPADTVVREGGVQAPDLCAIRPYAAGRIAFCAIWPQYSIGQGTEWLYERRVLDRGVGSRPSHFGRLIENVLRWLSEPPGTGGYVTLPGRLRPPNERAEVREPYLRAGGARSDPAQAVERALGRGRLLRGLIGAQTAFGVGDGSVADYAAAARRARLDFVVFLDDHAALDADELARLAADCARHSGEDLTLYPGYRIETNTGNRMFLFGPSVTLPPPELVIDGRLNQQHQDPTTGAFVRGGVLIDWLVYRVMASRGVNIGYYGFADRPTGQRVVDLRLYSMLGLRWFDEGRLVEDNLDGYLQAAAGTIPPIPAAVHLVATPAGLEQAAGRNAGLTYAQAAAPSSLWDALGYAHQYVSPNVFTSDGPRILAWPETVQYYTLGAERFVTRAALMPSPIVVESDLGLREIRIYDGERLFRRFLCGGARRFERLLELTASVQRNLVLVAEDVAGGRAVSHARRAWKGGDLAPVFCSDRINDCDAAPLLARGPGIVQVSRVPTVLAGATWDGGPEGERPILKLIQAHTPALVSDLGAEGGRSSFAGFAQLEVSDEGAVRVRTTLDTLYDSRVPPGNPWTSFGPLAGPSRLFRADASFTLFDRPTTGPRPSGPAGLPLGRDAQISLFESTVRFRRDQRLEELRLFRQIYYRGPFPVTLVRGRGRRISGTYDLTPGRRRLERLELKRGDWIGCYGPEATNLAVLVNLGDPLTIEFHGADGVTMLFAAAVRDVPVREGETRRFAVLSVVDPIDAPRRDADRILRIVRYLRAPEGLSLLRGGRIANGGSPGLLELEAAAGAVELRIGRPASPTRLPLPVRVHGLNPRWSAGVFLRRGYVRGNYGAGVDRYRAAGFDFDGRVHETLFPDAAPRTEAVIGHPVTCDRAELFIQVTRRHDGDDPSVWHVSVNNPTDEPLRTTFRAAMGLAGLTVDGVTRTIPAGGYVVLQ